jgi:methylenetetrahydrofolate dehydrogenase (NADP+)/methenyltetrahydrofolate cyclohydrolase
MRNFLKLEGKKVAESVQAELVQERALFEKRAGRQPSLHVILVGDNPASEVYVGHKEKLARQLGFESRVWRFDAKITQSELETHVQQLVKDQTVDGILVQLPLPKPLRAQRIMSLIPIEKDVDGLTPEAFGLLAAGEAPAVACTPAGVMEILRYYKIPLQGKHAVVVGRSQIVGKPMALLLLNADCTVTICHSRTLDLKVWTRQADLVVAAAGQRHLLSSADFKPGAVVVDVGIHRNPDQRLSGDVNPIGLENVLSAATPVPGGVGPMTIMMLMKNTLSLARLRAEKRQPPNGKR